MSTQLKVGNFIVKSERQYEIKRITEKHEYVLEDTINETIVKYTRRELNDLIFIGTVDVISSDSRYNELHNEKAKDFHSYPEELKAEARQRYLFVKAFKDEKIKGCSKDTLDPLIAIVSVKADVKKISWRTLKRYLDAYEEYGIKGLIPKTKKKGNRKSRKNEKLEKLIIEALEKYKSSTRPTLKTAYTYLNDYVVLHNLEIESNESNPSSDELLEMVGDKIQDLKEADKIIMKAREDWFKDDQNNV